MKTDFFALYDAIIDGVTSEDRIRLAGAGSFWSLAETETASGLAMTTEGGCIPTGCPGGFEGLTLREAAPAVKSWNFTDAAFGLAACNAFYNTAENMDRLSSYEPFENYCTAGLNFRGKTVGMIGHLHGPDYIREDAKEVYIIEKHPQPGDYPDSACDYILPQCDIVLITGSSLVNKTLPHLLELCTDSYVILTGPSVPMCPALLDFGIDRLAGMVVSDRPGIRSKVLNSAPGSPYPFGTSFLLGRK